MMKRPRLVLEHDSISLPGAGLVSPNTLYILYLYAEGEEDEAKLKDKTRQ